MPLAPLTWRDRGFTRYVAISVAVHAAAVLLLVRAIAERAGAAPLDESAVYLVLGPDFGEGAGGLPGPPGPAGPETPDDPEPAPPPEADEALVEPVVTDVPPEEVPVSGTAQVAGEGEGTEAG